MNAILANLSKIGINGPISEVKYAKACLRKLKSDHCINYSLEIGVKTFNLTQNLNPRSQLKQDQSPDKLEQALELECNIEDASFKADTHLNICAVLSQMGRHELAMNHA